MEGDGDGARLWVEELVDCGEPVVELVQHPVDVPLEDGAGVGHPQHPPLAAQQRSPHLLLQPAEGSRDRGLGDHLDLAHLGDGHPVGDELEPTQGSDVHTYDASA
ncbi:hypothetical protein BJF82_12810 [Kytococcus sp. CUA-901]|nr:hypothetical protein BJF82_12810 [Kytococcus sp. CUA-901]